MIWAKYAAFAYCFSQKYARIALFCEVFVGKDWEVHIFGDF